MYSNTKPVVRELDLHQQTSRTTRSERLKKEQFEPCRLMNYYRTKLKCCFKLGCVPSLVTKVDKHTEIVLTRCNSNVARSSSSQNSKERDVIKLTNQL